MPAIRKTADLVQEVAAASAEQSAGVGQVSKAMGVVDQVTQRNASAAEELSSTAEEMSSQAESLQQVMSFFAVKEHAAPARFHAISHGPNGHAPAAKLPPHAAPAAPAKPDKAAPQAAVAQGKGNGSSDAGFKRF